MPQRLTHCQNRIGLEAPAGLLELKQTAWWEGLWTGNSHLPAWAHLFVLLPRHEGGERREAEARLGIETCGNTVRVISISLCC